MTYVHKVKCMHCGLHFQVFSWDDGWFPRGCPECLTKFTEVGGYMHWLDQTALQIYEFVPGPAPGNPKISLNKAIAKNNNTPVDVDVIGNDAFGT